MFAALHDEISLECIWIYMAEVISRKDFLNDKIFIGQVFRVLKQSLLRDYRTFSTRFTDTLRINLTLKSPLEFFIQFDTVKS